MFAKTDFCGAGNPRIGKKRGGAPVKNASIDILPEEYKQKSAG